MRLISLGVLALVAACGRDVSPVRSTTAVRLREPIAWVEQVGGGEASPLSVTATLERSPEGSTGVTCRTEPGRLPIHYLIYERRGEVEDYGIYGLGGAKNGMTMPLPFDPSSIRYEDRTVQQALRGQLLELGVTEAEVSALLEEAPGLFAEGRRVIFSLDAERAPDIAQQYLAGAREPFLLTIELAPN